MTVPHNPPDPPTDRAHISTEQRNPRTLHLHSTSVRACVDLIRAEDAAVLEALEAAAPALTAFIENLVPRFAEGGRLIYVGAGTSGRLGVLDAAEAPPTFQVEPGRVVGLIAGGDRALRVSSEGLEDDPEGAAAELLALGLTGDDTVLGIAAGATTPYARGALSIAKRLAPGCLTGFLTCSACERPPHADHLIFLPTGPEVVTGSTRMKAGTATKLALNTISTTLMVQTGRVYENLMVDVRASNAKLRDRAARIVSTLTGLSRDEAFALLEHAGGSAGEGSVKVAVVMHRLRLSAAAAQERLDAVGGRLDRVV
ncbi:MAG: N-acetylmuramic acid 6-phosphate etherase [Planctomycetota bacterium]|nr:N-acetylmuramic acid 6-phosphate etherase [Planctomycetota bacterium]